MVPMRLTLRDSVKLRVGAFVNVELDWNLHRQQELKYLHSAHGNVTSELMQHKLIDFR